MPQPNPLATSRNIDSRMARENSVPLAAVSLVKKRTPPEPKPLRVSGR
jgi:hypothetical protein